MECWRWGWASTANLASSEELIKPARELAGLLLEAILKDYDYVGKDVAMLVNGLGGTPLMELYILTNDIHELLAENGVSVKNIFVGNHTTSLEMAGCSVSLLDLTKINT